MPDPILAAYQTLLADRAALDTMYTEESAAAAAAAAAQNLATVKANARAGGVRTFDADKTALKLLIEETLTSGPPAAG